MRLSFGNSGNRRLSPCANNTQRANDMNAREFYEEFKAMLDFVGVGFSGMQDAIVTIRDGKIFVTAGNRSARLDVPEESE